MSIKSAMTICAEYSSGGTRLRWQRWNKIQNQQNKWVLNFYY